MPKENRTKFAILGMLDMSPMSGYDIRKCSDHSISHFWKEDYGHIYPTLKLLLDQGLATKAEEPASERKPAKHVYSITGAGREELATWLAEAPNAPNLRIELLLKVFFGSRAEPDRLKSMLKAEEASCRRSSEELVATEKQLVEGGAGNGRETRFQLMTLRYGKRYYESLGSWCRETLEELEAAD
jgi:DNA-binding PadR family transcriptional regulator